MEDDAKFILLITIAVAVFAVVVFLITYSMASLELRCYQENSTRTAVELKLLCD